MTGATVAGFRRAGNWKWGMGVFVIICQVEQEKYDREDMKVCFQLTVLGVALGLASCATLPEEEPMAVVSRFMLKDEFTGPKKGEVAPEFDGLTADGSRLRFSPGGKRPTLLVTGSYTCPIFRANVAGIRAIHRDFGERVDMYYLYTTEAHPVGSNSPYRDSEWVTRPNRTDGVLLEQTETLDERVARARKAQDDLGLPLTILVDSMDNTGWKAYGEAPSAAYLIGTDGRVVLRQGWVNPAKLDKTLKRMLNESQGS